MNGHKLGRKAAKKKLAVEELHEATSSAAKQQTDGVVFRWSRWEEIMKEIMTALKDNNNTNVIGLHGMGGVGKSTMLKEVYDQVKKQGMFDEVANVEVKVKPEIRRIQEEIAFALGLKFENEWSSTIRAEQLRTRLLRKNYEKYDTDQKTTVLIILDDLWEKLDLQEVGIPRDGNDEVHIKLFLTSRHEYLLSDKMGARNPIHLDVLGDADTLRMFKFFVGGGAEGVVGADKVSETATKCGGLPIVIEATAKALKNKDPIEWEKILKRLDSVDVLEKLRVSYDYLSSKESKNLFLICGIIRGPRIRVRDLLKYTFGLRLCNQKENSTLVAAAAKLEKLLSGLEAASMLLKSDDNRYVKIHNHMRSLAVRIVEEDHPEWAYDVTLNANSCELPDASKLKLLFSCSEEGDAMELRDIFLKDVKNLNVLEFTNLRVALSWPSSTTQLDHLRNLETLCLHNCSLDDISMIGELKGLQILSFRGSDICKLPIQLRGLTELKMLDLCNCTKLTQIELNVLGSLTKLEELNMENSFKDWEIEGGDAPPSNARLIELKNMSHLSNVRINIPSTSMLPKDGKLFSSELTMYQIMFGVAQKTARQLSEDKVCYNLFDDIDEKSISHYYPSDFSVDSGCYRKFGDEYNKFSRVLMLTFDSPDILWQDWVQSTLQTAEVLYLSGSFNEECESRDEVCIQGFECLKHLQLRNCPFRFITSYGSSTNLESLFLESLESLEKLCGGLPTHEEAFSKLRFMKIDGCSKLTYLFSFSLLKRRLFPQLEEITVEKCAEIQCIVVDEDDNNYDDVVTLSKLKKLELRWLPKFSNALFGGKKVAFSCLESLTIYKLDELEHIWHPTDPPAELGKLRLLQVEGCRKLVRVINSNVLMRLQQHLESLSIKMCRLMKEVFDVDDGIINSSCTDDEHDLVLFSRLKQLELRKNKNLMMMMVMKGGSWSTTIFPNIESLLVSDCPRLRYLLCCSLPTTVGVGGGGGYENIKEIRIADCREMEAIVEVMLKVVNRETQQAYNASRIANELVLFRRLKVLSLLWMEGLKSIYIMHNLSGRDDRVVTMFQGIETLKVAKCYGLRYVLPARVGGLVNLREITIHSCNQMESIVLSGVVDQETQPTVSYSFSSLQRMEISYCPRLRTFCHYISFEQDSDADDLPFFSQKEIYPCLEYLCLYHLFSDQLGEIWPHEVPSQTSFNMLRKVVVGDCPRLSVVFPSTLIACLENLTDIHVYRCDQLMHIIIVVEEKKSKYQLHCESERRDHEEASMATMMEMTFTFPCLRRLVLHSLGNLYSWFNSSSSLACSSEFPSLETLEIDGCFNFGLKTLFSQRQRRPTIGLVDGVDPDSDMIGALSTYRDALAMPNLKSLTLSGLEKLTSIWKEGEKSQGLILKLESLTLLRCCSSYRNIQSLLPSFCCSVLTQLTVEFSDGLEYVLTSAGATSLVHLTRLTIKSCDNIKEVVAVAEGEEASNENHGGINRVGDHDITFHHLKYLELHDLQRLEKFSSGVLNLPSLENLDIQNCPNMTTFSSGVVTASTHKFGDLNSFVQKIHTGWDDELRDFE